MVRFSRRGFIGGAAALFGAGGRPIGSAVFDSKPGKDKVKRS